MTMYTLNKHNLYLSIIFQHSLGQNTAYRTSPICQQRVTESKVKAVRLVESRYPDVKGIDGLGSVTYWLCDFESTTQPFRFHFPPMYYKDDKSCFLLEWLHNE